MSTLSVTGSWEQVLHGEAKTQLEHLLPDALRAKRWFGGKARPVKSTAITEVIPIPFDSARAQFMFVQIHFRDGGQETYSLPLCFASGDRARALLNEFPETLIARLRVKTADREEEGVLYDALWNEDFSSHLLSAFGEERSYPGASGELVASRTAVYDDLVDRHAGMRATVLNVEQSNTSVSFADRVMLKVYRRLGEGVNPDLELGRVLTKAKFRHIPALAGALEYRPKSGEPVTVAILQAYVRNQGDAWRQALGVIDGYFDRILRDRPGEPERRESAQPLLDSVEAEPSPLAHSLIGSYLGSVRDLGRRTAELHLVLAQQDGNPDFRPEPFSETYLQARYDSMCQLVQRTSRLLRDQVDELPHGVQADARKILDLEAGLLARFRTFRNLSCSGLRIRCHGDYHLGQVLCAEKDLLIIDFEGEPARPLPERRTKHSPLLDVAGMLRSFHYAVYAAMFDHMTRHEGDGERLSAALEPWAIFWYRWIRIGFLQSYLSVIRTAQYWPRSTEEAQVLLDAHYLEKAVYELGYELNHRPEWVRIPVQGILRFLENAP